MPCSSTPRTVQKERRHFSSYQSELCTWSNWYLNRRPSGSKATFWLTAAPNPQRHHMSNGNICISLRFLYFVKVLMRCFLNMPFSSIPFPPRLMGGIAACVSSACSIADYMVHAASQQLFLCYGDGALGKLFSKQRLTRWLYEGISHAWELADSDPRSHWRALC